MANNFFMVFRNPITAALHTLAINLPGFFPGFDPIDKFGENPDVDTAGPEDIWEGGGLYTFDTNGTAPIISIASNSALDTQPIEIQGLDIDGNKVTQTITLEGTTRKALTTPLWRIFRMANMADTGNDINGEVFCYTGTGAVPTIGDPNVRAIIRDGNNQTLMSIFTIQKGKVGFLFRGEIGVSRGVAAAEVRAAYYSRRYGKVFRVKKRVNLSNSGTSIYSDKRSFPDIIPALADIKLTVELVSANNIGVFGTFDILEIDEKYFKTSYLQAIGQPGY